MVASEATYWGLSTDLVLEALISDHRCCQLKVKANSLAASSPEFFNGKTLVQREQSHEPAFAGRVHSHDGF